MLGLPNAQSYPRLAAIGELHASGFENLTNAGDGAGANFFASLEANDCLASDPSGGRYFTALKPSAALAIRH